MSFNSKQCMLIALFISIITIVLFELLLVSNVHRMDKKTQHVTLLNCRSVKPPREQNKQKLVFLSIYISPNLPIWFDLFVSTVQGNAEYLDWLVFITDPHLLAELTLCQHYSQYSNMRFILLPEENLLHRMAMVDESYRHAHENQREIEKSRVREVLCQVLKAFPYVVVEFKSALGDIFKDYTAQYSHWAYADMDILLGDMGILQWEQMLSDFDIITFTHGDHSSLYLRGQLTLFKNIPLLSSLYSHCPHLQHLMQRAEEYLSEDSERRRWRLQSAEGCISYLAYRSNFTVLYLPLQSSDAEKKMRRGEEKVVVVIGRGTEGKEDDRGKGKEREERRKEGERVRGLGTEKENIRGGRRSEVFKCTNLNNSLKISELRSEISLPTRREIEERGEQREVFVGEEIGERCSYWIDPRYDLCVSSPPSPFSLLLLHNSLSYSLLLTLPLLGGGGRDCSPSLFHHFQSLKKRLSPSLLGQRPEAETTGGEEKRREGERYVVSTEGIFPLPSKGYRRERGYCQLPDPSLLSCLCPLPPLSVQTETILVKERKRGLERVEASFSPLSSTLIIEREGTRKTIIMSASNCSLSPSLLSPLPLLYNILLDHWGEERREEERWKENLLLSLSLPAFVPSESNPLSLSFLFLLCAGERESSLIGREIEERGRRGDTIIITVRTVIPSRYWREMLRFPEELSSLSLPSFCPLLPHYLPGLFPPSPSLSPSDPLSLLLFHFHLLFREERGDAVVYLPSRPQSEEGQGDVRGGEEEEEEGEEDEEREIEGVAYGGERIGKIMKSCADSLPAPYRHFLQTWQRYVKRRREIREERSLL